MSTSFTSRITGFSGLQNFRMHNPGQGFYGDNTNPDDTKPNDRKCCYKGYYTAALANSAIIQAEAAGNGDDGSVDFSKFRQSQNYSMRYEVIPINRDLKNVSPANWIVLFKNYPLKIVDVLGFSIGAYKNDNTSYITKQSATILGGFSRKPKKVIVADDSVQDNVLDAYGGSSDVMDEEADNPEYLSKGFWHAIGDERNPHFVSRGIAIVQGGHGVACCCGAFRFGMVSCSSADHGNGVNFSSSDVRASNPNAKGEISPFFRPAIDLMVDQETNPATGETDYTNYMFAEDTVGQRKFVSMILICACPESDDVEKNLCANVDERG